MKMEVYFFLFYILQLNSKNYILFFCIECLKTYTIVRTLFYKGKVDYNEDEIASPYCKMRATKSPTKIPNILSHKTQLS